MEQLEEVKSNTIISLFYKEGSSDKEYNVSIDRVDESDLFKVKISYGRRGSSLQTLTKTKVPVDFETASKLASKLVVEKQAKGYQVITDTSEVIYKPVDKTDTGIYPQLLNSIDLDQAKRLIDDDNYIMQEKYDGQRRLVVKDSDTYEEVKVIGINRKGLVVSLSKNLVKDLIDKTKYKNFTLDGEIIGDTLHVFDLLTSSTDLMKFPAFERFKFLTDLIENSDFKYIKLIETAITRKEKLHLFISLVKANREGVVFKKKDSLYKPGRPNSGGDQLKYKFYETASFIAGHPRNEDKRSVELTLWQYDGYLGNVSIPVNHKIPLPGTVIEVRYLYAFKEGSVYQPVYLGTRSDIEKRECLVSQLKYKPI